jgi:small subunit ribosomal protein S16
MLRIRLSRTGKKKQPSYRVVVADIEAKRDGRIVERLGYYDPLTEPIEYRIKEDRALYWLSVGAQPTDAVRRLLETQGTMDRLARLRQGEAMDELVAEYTGIPVESAAVSEVADEVAVEEMAAAVATDAIVEEE